MATYLLLDDVGAPRIRPTKDLDIVLLAKPSGEFLNAIKDYVKTGGYEIQRSSKNQAAFYRFQRPKDENFPVMIELFASIDVESTFKLFEGQHIIPVESSSGGIASLSAILLDKEYYALIRKNGVERGGIYILNEKGLIPFKAKAYLEIKERGEDSKNWKKHRGDIINLAVSFLTEENKEKLSGKVRAHFVEFIFQLKNELTTEIVKGACNQEVPPEAVIELLESTFL